MNLSLIKSFNNLSMLFILTDANKKVLQINFTLAWKDEFSLKAIEKLCATVNTDVCRNTWE